MAAPEPRSAEQAFRIGFVGNGLMAVLKLAVGWIAGSRSLIADGWHSLADIATNGGVWVAHRLAKRAPDDDHHYGHGKLEAFAGLVVGLVLLGAGVGVGISAMTSPIELRGDWAPWVAIGVAVASILGNVWLALVARRGARAAHSQGLAALFRDNLSDALAGVLVVLGILGARVGLTWAEPAAAVAIGGLILWMGWLSVVDGFNVLMDRADPALRTRLAATALRVAEVRGVQSARVHPHGSHVSVDMEISVDRDLTVEEGHRIAHSVESAVTTAFATVEQVRVHVNPDRPSLPDPREAASRPASGERID